MRWVWPTVTAAIIADALHLRSRIEALDVLEATDEAASPAYRLVTAAGVEVDAATLRAASAHATREGLDALDLVPADLPVERLLDLLRFVDPAAFRTNPLAAGQGALTAVLVSEKVVAAAHLDTFEGLDEAAMDDLTRRVKYYAPRTMAHALAPGLRASEASARNRVTNLVDSIGKPLTVTGFAVDLGLLVAAARTRRPGVLAAAAARLAQPALAVGGTAAEPRDMPGAVPVRLVASAAALPKALAARQRVVSTEDPEVAREEYEKLLADGIDRFFEPRRPDCPICGSEELSVRARCTDLMQNKPGEFFLEECASCGHIFQNPRLSLEGLDFYYRDFYDGASERMVEGVFGNIPSLYAARAEMVRPFMTPTRWLDVGGGHGHFCLAAQDTWPDTRFDILEISETVDEAERRGWVDTAYTGMFPDLAPDLAGAYDVVSMSHYLEHTRDPAAEVAAAATALAEGGMFLVEVPDPSSRISHVLRKYWFPWFQPQHQHFLSVENLSRLMDEAGFEVVAVERSEVHIPVDFSASAGLVVNKLYPRIGVPWRPRPTAADRLKRGAAIAAGMPIIAAGTVADLAVRPIGGRFQTSNAYRVLARRRPGSRPG